MNCVMSLEGYHNLILSDISFNCEMDIWYYIVNDTAMGRYPSFDMFSGF